MITTTNPNPHPSTIAATSSTDTPVCANAAHSQVPTDMQARVNAIRSDGVFPSRRPIQSPCFRSATLLLLLGALAPKLAAQETQLPMPASAQQNEPAGHHHADIKPVEPHYPQLGRAQSSATTPLITLEQLQKLARDHNPTLKQAEAEIRAANARRQQAGLYPNPSVGYTGDEIRGGSVGGGKQGFFVEQTIVTGGKLRLAKDVLGHEAQLATIEAEEQRIRVESAVKMALHPRPRRAGTPGRSPRPLQDRAGFRRNRAPPLQHRPGRRNRSPRLRSGRPAHAHRRPHAGKHAARGVALPLCRRRPTRHAARQRRRRPRKRLAAAQRRRSRGSDRQGKSRRAHCRHQRNARPGGARTRPPRTHPRHHRPRRYGVQQRTARLCPLRQRLGRHRRAESGAALLQPQSRQHTAETLGVDTIIVALDRPHNMIRVEKAGNYLRLLVDAEMLNLEEPVGILVDERIHMVHVRRSCDVSIETVRQRGDPRYIFDASITLVRTCEGLCITVNN